MTTSTSTTTPAGQTTTSPTKSNTRTSDDMWREVLGVWPQLKHLTRVEFPRISSTTLCKLANASSEQLISCVAANVFPRELSLAGLTGMRQLRELKLKTTTGKMKMAGNLEALRELAPTLTKLVGRKYIKFALVGASCNLFFSFQSLLSLDRLTPPDLEHISSLSNLEHLELGDCADLSLNSSSTFLNKFASLKSLSSLRLEGAHLGNNLGDLRWLTKLEVLELIDVHLKEGFGDGLVKLQTIKYLLLIPDYKDEVIIMCNACLPTYVEY